MKILTNVSSTELTLNDFKGAVLAPGDTIDSLAFGADMLRASSDIMVNLLTGRLSVTEGTTLYLGMQAVDLLRGVASQLTRDGKQIFTSSDRPKDTYRHLTSRGDDMTSNKIGQGQKLVFNVAPGQSQSIDMKFLEDIFIKDGYASYGKSESDECWLNVAVVAPAGSPFPSLGGNTGNYDLTPTGWVANATNTGAYSIVGVETVLQLFGNALPLPSFNNTIALESTEPQLIPSHYIIRVTAFNGIDATSNLKVYAHIGCYRKTSIN